VYKRQDICWEPFEFGWPVVIAVPTINGFSA
jgi:hypothetical protein